MNIDLENVWCWIAPFFIWCMDHYGFLFAVILFTLQLVFQVIRLRREWSKDCRERRELKEAKQ